MPPRRLARNHTLRGAALIVSAAALGACQDPSGVGLGLIGEDGGLPGATVLAADSVVLSTAGEPATGGYGTPGSALQPQNRILVGRVEDPLVGGAEAVAYLDVRAPSSLPDGFRDRPITSATLRLTRSYVYGDSLATLRLALSEVAAGWAPVALPADTGFVTGPALVTQDVAAADTLVQFALPPEWVAINDADLRSDSSASAFDGFQLRVDGAPPLPGVIVGFQTSNDSDVLSSLRITNSRDTVDFPVYEVYTSLTRSAPAMPPPDRLLLRAGLNEAIVLGFDYSALASLAVAGATLRLDADASVVETPGFHRPLPPELALFAVREDSSRAFLARGLRSGEDVYSFTSNSLTSVIQREVLGESDFVRFEVGAPSSPVSLDVLPVYLGPPPATPAEDRRPRLVVTAIDTSP